MPASELPKWHRFFLHLGNDHPAEHYYLAEIAAGLARLGNPGIAFSRDEFLIPFTVSYQEVQKTEEQIQHEQEISKSFWDAFLGIPPEARQ